MPRYCKRHCFVWHVYGDEGRIICAHCGFTKNTWESQDIEGDMRRASHSKEAHKRVCAV